MPWNSSPVDVKCEMLSWRSHRAARARGADVVGQLKAQQVTAQTREAVQQVLRETTAALAEELTWASEHMLKCAAQAGRQLELFHAKVSQKLESAHFQAAGASRKPP